MTGYTGYKKLSIDPDSEAKAADQILDTILGLAPASDLPGPYHLQRRYFDRLFKLECYQRTRRALPHPHELYEQITGEKW